MPQSRIRFDTFELDLETGELQKAGNPVPLQEKPARLLILLARRQGELVTRDEIQRALWEDGEFVEFEHSVNTAIHKVRTAIEDDIETQRIIQTLPKKGYRFIAEVNFVPPPTPPQPVTIDHSLEKNSHREEEFVLPISARACQLLFLLAQIPYVASYMAVLYNVDTLGAALLRTFQGIPVTWGEPGLQILALLGFAVRIYLIGLVGWGHTDAGRRYRALFPFLFVLDAIWAATPLLVQRAGPLLPWAGVILMGWLIFGQRTLMRSLELKTCTRPASDFSL